MEKVPLNKDVDGVTKHSKDASAVGDSETPDGPLRSEWGADWPSFVALKLQGLGVHISEIEARTYKLPVWRRAVWSLQWVVWLLTFSHATFIINHGNKTLLKETDFPPVQHHETSKRLSDLLLNAWEEERKKPKPSVVKIIFRVFWVELVMVLSIGVIMSACRIAEALEIGALVRVFQDPTKSNEEGYMWAALLTLTVMLDATVRGLMFYWAVRTGFNMRVGMISTIYRKTLNLSMSHASSTGTIVNLVSNDVQRFEDAAPFATFAISAPIESLVILAILWTYIGVSALAGFAAIFSIIPIQAFFSRTFAKLRTYVVGWRDDRIRNTSDVLLGMSVVKLYSWEEAFRSKLQSIRDSEMVYLTRSSLMRAVNDTSFIASPALIGLTTWCTYWALGNALASDKVFIALSLFNVTRQSMTGQLPKAIQFLSESMISINRIQEFLLLPEIQIHNDDGDSHLDTQNTDEKPVSDNVLVRMKNATFAWNTDTGSFGRSILETLKDSKKDKAGDDGSTKGQDKSTKNPKATELGESGASEAHSTAVASSRTDGTEDRTELMVSGSEHSNLKVILKDISLDLVRGKLVCVVGPVGAGKSSLIMGMLSEMITLSGRTTFYSNKVAYCPQAPWIVSGSVRENVLFGYEYDEARFKRTIDMCAMTRDLELFADGANALI
ncbi:Multidrug resistance-associated protein 4, partial [Gonapodya sp. JEL0774]